MGIVNFIEINEIGICSPCDLHEAVNITQTRQPLIHSSIHMTRSCSKGSHRSHRDIGKSSNPGMSIHAMIHRIANVFEDRDALSIGILLVENISLTCNASVNYAWLSATSSKTLVVVVFVVGGGGGGGGVVYAHGSWHGGKSIQLHRWRQPDPFPHVWWTNI